MRKVLFSLLSLLAGFLLLGALALSQTARLRPLTLSSKSATSAITAKPTDHAALLKAGYTLKDWGDGSRGGNRERSYSFQDPSGSWAMLVDNERSSPVVNRRELIFDVTFSVREGRSADDMFAITPKLVAEALNAVRQNPAVVAGLGYLATAADSGVAPEELQAAVIGYTLKYRQPSTPIHKACAICGSQDGFGDEYDGLPDVRAPLDVRRAGWAIAGIRRYRNGNGAFTLEVSARIPRG
jgi:hypothetical protein